MSWGTINGEERIVPSTGAGGADEVKFESNKAKKIALILPNGAEPYSYFEHCIEIEKIENGQQKRDFRTVRCPKTSKNPNAECPLCDGQQARRRVRNACNVYDYDLQKVQKLNAGDSIFKPIGTTMKMGVDILAVDWGIMKTGEGRNDTEYTCTNLGPRLVPYDPATMTLFPIEQDFAPHTIDDMKMIVESIGGDWNKLIVPPALSYPTLAEALAHKMPNGKYKDQTMEQIWEADKSNRGMINYLATKSDRVSPEKAAAQVIIVRLGGANIDGVPKADGEVTPPPATQSAPPVQQTAPPTTPPPATQTQPATPPVSTERTAVVNEINTIFASSEKFKAGGFTMIIETMKKYGNGKTNITDFTDAELSALLTACKE